MQLSESIKLYPSKAQEKQIRETMLIYISTVNKLVDMALCGKKISKFSSKDVSAHLPSALKNQCIRDAKSILRKYRKTCKKDKNATIPVLKKPCFYVNNQNFSIEDSFVEFPLFLGGKTTRLKVKSSVTEEQHRIFENTKLGTMRVVLKNQKIIVQVVYEKTELPPQKSDMVMGVDLGIKCPAVSYCSDGHVAFYGNGRKNKFIRRHYKSLRQTLGKRKKFHAIKRLSNKEQRIMKDIDHKISRKIVDTAKAHRVSIIKLEQLTNIRSTTRTSRKNTHNLHNWSFYRLAMYIEYKAALAGIKVEYVNPAYTSQECPLCHQNNHANDRIYRCGCGYQGHRDLVGAINICNSTEYVGNRHTA